MSRALEIIKDEEPWYSGGLNFQCTECGQCCTGSPGYVWVSEEEISKLAAHLNLTVEKFRNAYLRKVGKRFSLKEKIDTENSDKYDCIFLKDKKCSVYALRPTQCRTFPWWPQHLKSKQDWEEAAKYCEGIKKSAPNVPSEKINTQLKIQQDYYQVSLFSE